MLDGPRGWKSVPAWMHEHPKLMKRVMDRIRREGGLRSADFETNQKRAGAGWYWKDEKIALACLFILGELMIARRQAFQRVYDLRSRVLPGWDDGPSAANVPSRREFLLALTLRAVEALGAALAAWVPDYFGLPKTGNARRPEELATDGRLQRVEIEGLPGPAYRHPRARSVEQSNVTTLDPKAHRALRHHQPQAAHARPHRGAQVLLSR